MSITPLLCIHFISSLWMRLVVGLGASLLYVLVLLDVQCFDAFLCTVLNLRFCAPFAVHWLAQISLRRSFCALSECLLVFCSVFFLRMRRVFGLLSVLKLFRLFAYVLQLFSILSILVRSSWLGSLSLLGAPCPRSARFRPLMNFRSCPG